MPPIEIQRIERIGHADALVLQEELAARRSRDEIGDRLLLLEHDAVITAGRSTPKDLDPETLSAPLVPVARGGELTWHGPGQTVGYWIRKLSGPERDLHRHLRLIEDALIATVAEFGVPGGRRDGATGVWVGERKIASIGVGVRNWVTMHGFALNRSVDPTSWRGFAPCGFPSGVMTDLAFCAPSGAPERDVLEATIARAFRDLGRHA